jgi:HD-GYP domain-containing protein (c-di-GMP phosphodiesterase class II)
MGNGAISLEARIVAVADVFQTLAQTRPYREALDANAIMYILREQVVSGHLDATVVVGVLSLICTRVLKWLIVSDAVCWLWRYNTDFYFTHSEEETP